MEVLNCILFSQQNHSESTVMWTSNAPWRLNLTSNMPPVEQVRMGVLVHKGSLVILSVSRRQQGNYSCSVG